MAPEMLNLAYLLAFILLLLISGFILTRKNTLEIAGEHPLNGRLCVFVTVIFVWSVISFSQVSTFIYFNF